MKERRENASQNWGETTEVGGNKVKSTVLKIVYSGRILPNPLMQEKIENKMRKPPLKPLLKPKTQTTTE